MLRYGTTQTLKLPQKDFKFLQEKEYSIIDWKTVDLDGEIGYFVECTLDYPMEIRMFTKDFPLCPENREITFKMLSPYQQELLRNTHDKTAYKQKKLTATFLERKQM